MQKIPFASLLLLIVLSMFMLSVKSINLRESHETLRGIDPSSGFRVEYGC